MPFLRGPTNRYRLTPVILELGGKDPFIILDDAEMDQAIQVALRGAFVNCGQNCIAAEEDLRPRRYYYSRFHYKVYNLHS